MKKHLYLIFLLICSYALAHDAHYDKSSERNWKIIKELFFRLKNSFQHYFRNSAQNTALNKGGDNNKLDK
jgi:hypothetical protein